MLTCKTNTMGFLSVAELNALGLRALGENVLISERASLYSPHLISIGSHVRIDDFCILSGEITLGSHIHIGAFCGLYGKFGIHMADYTGLSPRCTLFSATDDFGGDFLISPMSPPELCNVTGGPIRLESFAQIGAHTVILPNVTVATGAAVGAMSLVKRDLDPWSLYAGCPVRRLRDRSRRCASLLQAV